MKRNRKILYIMILGIIAICFSKFPLGKKVSATMADEEIIVQTEYGYDSYAKFGRYMPITAKVSSKEDFSGWLEASIPLKEESKVYRKEVSIAAGQTEEVSMLIPLTGGYATIEIKLVDDEGDIIDESINQIQLGNYEKIIFAGVLSNDMPALSYLDNIAIKAFPLNEKTFPSDYLYLDNLDILIINDFDTSLLDEKQIDALQQWIIRGGTLVIASGKEALKAVEPIADEFGIGTTSSKTFDQSKLKLSSVSMDSYIDAEGIEELTYRRIRFEEEREMLRKGILEQNKQLLADGNPTIPITNLIEEDWPSKTIAEYKTPNITKDFANLYFLEKDFEEDLYYQRKELGRGNILLFNIDLATNGNDSEQTTYEHILVATILGNLSKSKQNQIYEDMEKGMMYSPIIDSMSYTDTENIPRVGKYIIILLIYIIVIGPVMYLLLKKKDKFGLIWITIPITAMIFTFIVYLAGSNTRVEEPFVGYLEMRTFKGDNTVEDELYFSLTAPYNDKYTLKVSPHYRVTELISRGQEFSSYGFRRIKTKPKKYQTSINYSSNNTMIEINNNPAFNPVYFQYRDEYIGKNPIEADIHYIGDIIEGSITNTSTNAIYNTMYIGDEFIFNIGRLSAGQTVDVSDLEIIFLHNSLDIFQSEIIEDIVSGKSGSIENESANDEEWKTNVDMVDKNRKREILYYLIDSHITSSPNESCIIGFAEDTNPNSLITEISNELDVYGTRAILSKIDVDYNQEDKVFVSSISSLIRKEEIDNFGRKGGKYDYKEHPDTVMEDETIIEYYFPKDEKVLSIEYYSLPNQATRVDYYELFTGKIYALNRKTGEFDHIFSKNDSKNEDTTLIATDKLANYLAQDNKLTLKYETGLSQINHEILLPNISYWKGGK